jgi:hypothetical protein
MYYTDITPERILMAFAGIYKEALSFTEAGKKFPILKSHYHHPHTRDCAPLS